MGIALKNEEFVSIRNLVAELSGIFVNDNKSYLIESRLGSLATENSCDTFNDLYLKARQAANIQLRDKICDLMTTNETLWFRDSHPYVTFEDLLLPEMIQKLKNKSAFKIKIWSSACSTGQEPYSLAMIILDAIRMDSSIRREAFEIIATDISKTALNLAFMGRYDSISMSRGLPEKFRNRYFTPNGRVCTISDDVKKMVKFKKFNLMELYDMLGSFDIVLCRNVAIYFPEDVKRNIFAKIAETLKPDGVLFLGASEAITGYSTAFDMHEHKRGIYYKLKGM